MTLSYVRTDKDEVRIDEVEEWVFFEFRDVQPFGEGRLWMSTVTTIGKHSCGLKVKSLITFNISHV